ncbi:hypothetical protein EC588_23800 [Klebsiella quasipneumoniae subsp. similipneumoniae]|nr:hypothetical protein EC588_23800 [Klebsiella quasipneumoniae subsp. similipneumoniae]
MTLIRYDPDIISVRVWSHTASRSPSPSYRTMTSSALCRPGPQVTSWHLHTADNKTYCDPDISRSPARAGYSEYT